MFFEANYCDETIDKVKHKYHDTYLNRLMSDYGHLSLNQTIDALVDCSHDMQKIILSHISENTNSYENTYIKIRNALNEVNKFPELLVGFQGEPSEWIE
jgi:hemerythrin-like domain-containing protein